MEEVLFTGKVFSLEEVTSHSEIVSTKCHYILICHPATPLTMYVQSVIVITSNNEKTLVTVTLTELPASMKLPPYVILN
jgi:hypothetical protein